MDPLALEELAAELRQRILQTVSRNGGHLSSNLGVVELTIALHRSFDFSRDQLIFDVGHQCYAHKLLTGRGDQFDTLRQYNGLTGFPRRGPVPRPGRPGPGSSCGGRGGGWRPDRRHVL